ncbi:MAG: hypothetical protein ACLQUZ_18975 [Rhizomicrobium sp.]
MPWYSCHLESRPALETTIQNRFETIFKAAGGPSEMLLVCQSHHPRVSTLWLRLPDEKYRSAFPEFNEADEGKLPKKAMLLIGDNAEFERLFKYGRED